MKNKILTICVIFFLLSSCSGFKLKRSDNSDEFLIEKKNPLVMPPDIDELPKPKEDLDINAEKENDFKEILDSNQKNSTDNNINSDNSDSSLTEIIIKKIEE